MFKKVLFFIIIFSLGFGFGHSYFTKKGLNVNTQVEKDTPQAFISEVYDKVLENYWDNISDAQLLEFFKTAFEKNGGSTYQAKFKSKDELIKAVKNTVSGMDDSQRNKFTSSLASDVLASLNPVGRSGLYTTKQEEQLKNTVENINPQKDLYKDLGIEKGSSPAAVEEAYQQKSQELTQDDSPQAQEKLKEITYAKEVLTQEDKKQNYDQAGVEPTIFTKVINSSVLYVQFKKFSPTSYEEFVKVFEAQKDNQNLSSLVFDLRGNVGGAIDATPYFLGHFIGKNISAFDFYHKGDYLPFKTPTDRLASILKYKQVVVLVDNQTQSSAELMAASFKKYRSGVVVGVPTKGWGTVERVFPLESQFDKTQKYSLFLVHSITLRDDNQPIEGRGVDPDVNIKNNNWEQSLFPYFRNPQLTEGLKTILSSEQ